MFTSSEQEISRYQNTLVLIRNKKVEVTFILNRKHALCHVDPKRYYCYYTYKINGSLALSKLCILGAIV